MKPLQIEDASPLSQELEQLSRRMVLELEQYLSERLPERADRPDRADSSIRDAASACLSNPSWRGVYWWMHRSIRGGRSC
jgi:hypothetical protein